MTALSGSSPEHTEDLIRDNGAVPLSLFVRLQPGERCNSTRQS